MADFDVDPDDEMADFYVHVATVETSRGTNADGADLYAPPVTVAGNWEGKSVLVLGPDGEQQLAQGMFRTSPANATPFVPLSRVTVEGATGRVIRINTYTSGALDLPDHVEIALT